jgi:hypothetical protein
LALADINSDGKPDIIVANRRGEKALSVVRHQVKVYVAAIRQFLLIAPRHCPCYTSVLAAQLTGNKPVFCVKSAPPMGIP